jgi:urease accessory protein
MDQSDSKPSDSKPSDSNPSDLNPSDLNPSDSNPSDSNSTRASNLRLLRLLQLVSPSLPVGAYSYSEGIETLTQAGSIDSRDRLQHWLTQELAVGAARLEGAIVVRAYRALQTPDFQAQLEYWNHWYGAARETEELRNQSLQMGRSMLKVLQGLEANVDSSVDSSVDSHGAMSSGVVWHFPIAFAIASVMWDLSLRDALLGYFQSWSSNLIAAGIKLIPLGQTDGQRIAWAMQDEIAQAVETVLGLGDEDLGSCGWGIAIASMQHETLYSRLFRS